MPPTWLTLPFLHLLLLAYPTPTTQVDITLSWWLEGMSYFEHLITAHFHAVPPGTCCKPSPAQLPSLHHSRAGETKFHHLRLSQFGAGWGATGWENRDIINCAGAPILRVFGPSDSTGSLDSDDEDDSVVA
ncbi:MAG: hypothetical protein Q9207_007650, partial [Kuettlingeria erythrocarpa]